MDELKMRFYRPVVTGTPHLDAFGASGVNRAQQDSQQASFEDVLKTQLESTGGVSFSKHAIKRAAEKNIEISQDSLERLNRGVQLAEEKNLGDTLIMVDQLAFLVNVKNQTVITAMQSGDKANVFTNIDGTVIV